MKAILFYEHGGPQVLEYSDFPTPEPGPGAGAGKVESRGYESSGPVGASRVAWNSTGISTHSRGRWGRYYRGNRCLESRSSSPEREW